MKKRVETLEEMFNKFQEQYIKNNKELTKVVITLEFLHNEIIENKKRDEKFQEEIKPVLEMYKTFINGRKIIMYMAVFISTIGTAFILIRNWFH